MNKIDCISSFTGEYRFLSNFCPTEIKFDGIMYPSVEHAYQAAKTLDLTERKLFSMSPPISAAEAKKLGRALTLRSDWENIKLQIMEDLLVQKFAHQDLQQKLIQTGTTLLVEGNYWSDTFWGVDHKKGGLNHLGKLLMKIREQLTKEI